MTFTEYVRKVRRGMEISQQKLADELNVSYTTVNRWENKRAVPSKLARKSFRDRNEPLLIFARRAGLRFRPKSLRMTNAARQWIEQAAPKPFREIRRLTIVDKHTGGLQPIVSGDMEITDSYFKMALTNGYIRKKIKTTNRISDT